MISHSALNRARLPFRHSRKIYLLVGKVGLEPTYS